MGFKYIIYSREQMEEIKSQLKNERDIVISITDNNPIQFPKGILVFQRSFYDFIEPYKDYKIFEYEDAQDILDYIEYKLATQPKIKNIIVNCEAGISRSSAIAAAIKFIFEQKVDKIFQEKHPNMRVFRYILNYFYEKQSKMKETYPHIWNKIYDKYTRFEEFYDNEGRDKYIKETRAKSTSNKSTKSGTKRTSPIKGGITKSTTTKRRTKKGTN